MLDGAKAVVEFMTDRTVHDYLTNRMLRNAVERNVEIIGEAAGRVSKEFRETTPDIPWKQIIAQRNVLIHEYGEIKHELVWKVATEHVPELKRKLERLISENNK